MPSDDFIPDESPEEETTEGVNEEAAPVEDPGPQPAPDPWGPGTEQMAQHLFKGVIGDPDATEQRRVELVEWDTALKDEARGGPKQDG